MKTMPPNNTGVNKAAINCPQNIRFADTTGDTDFLRVAPKRGGTVQQARDVITSNAKVRRDAHTFVAEVVRHRGAFDAP